MTGDDGRKDFYVSYNGADIGWAKWIAHVLEEAGYSVVIEAWDFRAGGNFILEMQRATEVAEQTVIVLSPRFMTSRFTQPEWAAAFAKDPDGRLRSLIPVRVEECTAEGMLAQVIYVDLVGLSETDAARKLLTGVGRERPKPATRPAFPGG